MELQAEQGGAKSCMTCFVPMRREYQPRILGATYELDRWSVLP
jgi:hypothetical protein